MKLFLVFVLFLNHIQAEQVWLVNFPYKQDYLSYIEKRFPLIDLIEYDYYQSSYIFLIPKISQSSFLRFIHKSKGSYRVLFENTKDLLKKSQPRTKRWTPSDNPLDQTYYQRFLSYDEQQDWYRLLANYSLTKNFTRLHNIGQTYENRSLTVVQISTKLHLKKKRQYLRKSVFIDGGMHAREWLSIGVANFMIAQFIKLKEKNTKVRTILNHFDIYILPMMNPDGYEYSRKENRLWRKNRSVTSTSDYWSIDLSCYGVDLNRNFPFQWNSTYGASPYACSHSYSGPSPMSELEAKSVVNFLQQNKTARSKFRAYFNLHAYGRFWLLPWTYSASKKIPHYDNLYNRSDQVVSKMMNGTYKIGQASTLLYPCSGTSIDFASTLMKHAITLELSPKYYGLPLCFERNLTSNDNCTVGFMSGPEVIQIDGTEIFNAIVEYLYDIIQDKFL